MREAYGQAPLSMGFSWQEYWSGLPCPSPGDLPYPGVELPSLMSSALADGFFTTSSTWKVPFAAYVPVTTTDYLDAAEHNREICDLTIHPWYNMEGQDSAHILICSEGSISRDAVCVGIFCC